jgi:hypothetical protein
MNEMANKDTLSSEDQGILLRQDWTELGFNDPVTKMEKVMRVDCWYELNADCPDGIFFLSFRSTTFAGLTSKNFKASLEEEEAHTVGEGNASVIHSSFEV